MDPKWGILSNYGPSWGFVPPAEPQGWETPQMSALRVKVDQTNDQGLDTKGKKASKDHT